MRYLADTHILLWVFESPRKLSREIVDVFLDPRSVIHFSPINLWEISLKYQLGKLSIHGVTPEEFLDELQSSFFECLPLDPSIAASSHQLPRLHGDPFDRMLIWQAISTGATLLSADSATDQYVPLGLSVLH
ncbi:MAG: type II toxin-antitoxin system VapC family toxin [Propionibacteriaceae bacterium]|nr:type II toxin-antitoxin system VapC family toxin [Propionibacteriaceae bacterium]